VKKSICLLLTSSMLFASCGGRQAHPVASYIAGDEKKSCMVLAITPEEAYQQWKANYDSNSITCFEAEYSIDNIELLYADQHELAIDYVKHLVKGNKFYKEENGHADSWEHEGKVIPEYNFSWKTSSDGVTHKFLQSEDFAIFSDASSFETLKRDTYCAEVLLLKETSEQACIVRRLIDLESDKKYVSAFSQGIELGVKTIKIGSEDVECIGFKRHFPPVPDGKIFTAEVWLAVDKGMLPVKFVADLDGVVEQTLDVHEIIELDGYFYPKKARTKQTRRRKDAASIKEYTLINFKRNPVHDCEIFDMKLAPGTRVSDKRINEEYTIY